MVNATLNPFKWCVWGHSASTGLLHVYLVWYFKILSSPYLQPWVIQTQLKEEVSLYGKETTRHGWRPTGIKTDTHPHTDTYSNLNTILHIKCYSVFQVGVGDPANKKSITIRGLNCNFQAFHEKNDGTSRSSLNKRRPPPLTISIYSSYVISESILRVCDCQRGGGECPLVNWSRMAVSSSQMEVKVKNKMLKWVAEYTSPSKVCVWETLKEDINTTISTILLKSRLWQPINDIY